MRITHTMSLQETRQEANCTTMHFSKSWTSGEVSKNQRFTTTTVIFDKRKRPVILTHTRKTMEQWVSVLYQQ